MRATSRWPRTAPSEALRGPGHPAGRVPRPIRLINRRPTRPLTVFLASLPFVAVVVAYVIGSDIRQAANPSDKLLPAPGTIAETAVRLFTEGDRRTGQILLWHDPLASLSRLFGGVAIAATISLTLGMLIGLIPDARRTFSGFVAVLSMVPPLALLPILFIVFGLGETSKVVLIVIGITPFRTRDRAQRVLDIPHDPGAYGATITYDFDVRDQGIPFQKILDRYPSLKRAAED